MLISLPMYVHMCLGAGVWMWLWVGGRGLYIDATSPTYGAALDRPGLGSSWPLTNCQHGLFSLTMRAYQLEKQPVTWTGKSRAGSHCLRPSVYLFRALGRVMFMNFAYLRSHIAQFLQRYCHSDVLCLRSPSPIAFSNSQWDVTMPNKVVV